MEEFSLEEQEVRKIIKYKTTVLFYEEEYAENKRGIKAVYSILHEKRGFETKKIRRLIVNYPTILSKSEEDLEAFFKVLAEHGVQSKDAFDQLQQVPKLIS